MCARCKLIMLTTWNFIVRTRRRVCFFFFQAEDGIRDYKVTGVQTCALPISFRTVPRTATGRRDSVRTPGISFHPNRSHNGPRLVPPFCASSAELPELRYAVRDRKSVV